ncbi:hypothetical protein FRX31_027799, partial [Thalictrum thalictroides]
CVAVETSVGLDNEEGAGTDDLIINVSNDADVAIDGTIDDDEDGIGMGFCNVGFVIEKVDGDGVWWKKCEY